ncbi:MAG TPA: plastocyanin/azurin family copper-binding protein [Gemmatimonadales bacterium]|nr:plastocyanin/azurin family copper-binding protein [Gemmatimonadales bacterium]
MRPNLVSALAVLLTGCGGLNLTSSNGNTGGGNTGPTASITVQDYAYAPSVINIKVGTKVNWTNDGPSSHSVTSDSIGFDSGALAGPKPNPYGGMTNGGLFQMTFLTPGTYSYHCMFHAQMHGTITVQP